MSKLNDIQVARNEGLNLALQIVKEKGIDGLKEEIKFRNITGIHSPLTKADLEKLEVKFKKQVIIYYTSAAVYVLKEKFGFGKVRIKRFYDLFEDLCDSVMRKYLTLEDIIDYLKEECDIDLKSKE